MGKVAFSKVPGGDFLSGPGVKAQPSNAGGMGSIPQGNYDSTCHGVWLKKRELVHFNNQNNPTKKMVKRLQQFPK